MIFQKSCFSNVGKIKMNIAKWITNTGKWIMNVENYFLVFINRDKKTRLLAIHFKFILSPLFYIEIKGLLAVQYRW